MALPGAGMRPPDMDVDDTEVGRRLVPCLDRARFSLWAGTGK